MRSVARLVAVLLPIVVASSCQSASPQAESIRVTVNPGAVRGCKFLANVEGSSGFATESIASNNATVEMREKAAKLGANVILAVSVGPKAIGEAYLCSNPAQ